MPVSLLSLAHNFVHVVLDLCRLCCHKPTVTEEPTSSRRGVLFYEKTRVLNADPLDMRHLGWAGLAVAIRQTHLALVFAFALVKRRCLGILLERLAASRRVTATPIPDVWTGYSFVIEGRGPWNRVHSRPASITSVLPPSFCLKIRRPATRLLSGREGPSPVEIGSPVMPGPPDFEGQELGRNRRALAIFNVFDQVPGSLEILPATRAEEERVVRVLLSAC